jgi:hypothetical protein
MPDVVGYSATIRCRDSPGDLVTQPPWPGPPPQQPYGVDPAGRWPPGGPSWQPYANDGNAGVPVAVSTAVKPPGTIALAAAISVVLAAAFGVLGITLIFALGIALEAAKTALDSAFGASAFPTLTNSSIGNQLQGYETGYVLISVVIVILAIALAWGAVSAITGSSVGTAVVANIVVVLVLLYAVINIHPLLLLLMLLPIVALLALLSPSSRSHGG